MNKAFRSMLAMAAIAAVSGQVSAQVYVSAGIGGGRIASSCDSDATSCSKSGLSVKLRAGYEFGDNISAEISYQTFGHARQTFPNDESDRVKLAAFGLGGVYRHQFTDGWGVAARLGIARVQARYTSYDGGQQVFSSSPKSTKPYLGFAVTYALTKQLRAEAAIDAVKFSAEDAKISARSYNMGLAYSF